MLPPNSQGVLLLPTLRGTGEHEVARHPCRMAPHCHLATSLECLLPLCIENRRQEEVSTTFDRIQDRSIWQNFTYVRNIVNMQKFKEIRICKSGICKHIRTYIHINPAKPNTHTYVRFLVSTTVHCMEQSRSSATL